MSARIIDKDSSWNRRFGKGHFTGVEIPFGALVHYMPPKPELARLGEFDAPTLPGLFLGYKFMPGGRWRNEYDCVPIRDIKTVGTCGWEA